MGVDFDFCEAHWSYSGFHEFRKRLAAEIGLDLDQMYGFKKLDGAYTLDPTGVPWDGITDDIVPLLNHSDCDGELSAEECRRVEPRLRQLVEHWPLAGFPDDGYDRRHALMLADGMRRAYRAGENGYPLRFH